MTTHHYNPISTCLLYDHKHKDKLKRKQHIIDNQTTMGWKYQNQQQPERVKHEQPITYCVGRTSCEGHYRNCLN